ncbi:glycine betaine/L-proline ABC transporter ATP-binding protein [Ornithinimicrobium faecis]|uniref:Glycine betaine/L-proline ABC transporter ATP-binding protein n=1 Tax=Ornithinimicrobium faecis TaxID=2934158 RepID=A0ABY4YV44_9MICO|nr:glycine betaine/L-proline ABC transporter ATP-binding protein [Ornithinimicrobium sp. HY1793]USQ80641.1 glycine betaine/L-proline ABC transporter ATP-binding protein [Ornithinimicrobium sp. HY1793]
MPALEANGVFKIFGRRPERGVRALQGGGTREELREQGLTAAVIDASFSVDPGEIFVVMGLSGSGKSTLIRTVNRLLDPTAGTVAIDGQDISNLDGRALREVRRKKISMVFQHFALMPHRTVGENAAYGLQVQGVNRSDRQARAEEALGMVGLGGWGGSKPDELSGGMRQRVGLARALAAGTDIMLMDEAFSALDPLIRREMQDQLIDLQQRLDKTILFITHDLNEAMRLGDRIAMMRDGRIEQIGSAEEILNNPVNNYVAEFVQDVDRTRVLTAANVMEQPVAVIGPGAGPQAAHKLMREHQVGWLLVVNRDRTVQGLVWSNAIAAAVREGRQELPLHQGELPFVTADTTLNELFLPAASSPAPIVVRDEQERLVGVIPDVTLLAAMGNTHPTANGKTGDDAPLGIPTPAPTGTEAR